MGILDGWSFCPRCASPLTRRLSSVNCTSCGWVGWSNPVPGAQAVVERDGRVLLGRRRSDPSAGLWDLPGGFVDEHEHPLEALERELREETGLAIEPTEFLGIWMQPYDDRNVLCLTWLAHPVRGTERAGDDLTELHWFGRDDLPAPVELAFSTFVEILSLWRARDEDA
ncbi:MAG: NUDIX domain-containing protein [Actinobacteria bacterium]|nr:NUDIX domain-containing protein [Actinomycetota bacterium]MDQ3162299.1 NUDIX domain-containing protein [Actinomycetota bacterium]